MTNIDREIGEIQANIKNMSKTAEIHQETMEKTTTRIETAVTEGLKEHGKRISKLEQHKAKLIGVGSVLIIAVPIAIKLIWG